MPRLVADDDWLYRKLDPPEWKPHWSPSRGIHPEAYQDGGPHSSLYLARLCSADECLLIFANRKWAKDLCGTASRKPTASEMYGAGFRVIKIQAAMVRALGLNFVIRNGHEYDDQGHVEIENGVEAMASLAASSVFAPEVECES